MARPYRSRREHRAVQENALRRLVAHAYAHVPFYRRHFDRHGLRPQDVRGSGRPGARAGDLAPRAPGGAASRPDGCRLRSRACHLRDLGLDRRAAAHRAHAARGRADLRASPARADPVGAETWHLRVNIGSPRRIFRWHRLGAFRIRTVENRPPYDDLLERVAALHPDVLMVTPETLDLIIEQAARDAAARARPHLHRRQSASGERAPARDRDLQSIAHRLLRDHRVQPGGMGVQPLRPLPHQRRQRDRRGRRRRRPLSLAGRGRRADPHRAPLARDAVPATAARRPGAAAASSRATARCASDRSSRSRDGSSTTCSSPAAGRWRRFESSRHRRDRRGRPLGAGAAERDAVRLRFEPLPGADAAAVEQEIRAGCAPLFPSEVELAVEVVRFEERAWSRSCISCAG